MDYDYIIVGAGAAGCVLAYRLSENPANRILLLEYGGRDVNPMHYVPKGFYFTLATGKYTYTYKTKPFKSDGSGEGWTRGKVVGGSTTVNGMMYTRGFQADYDRLVELGNPGWGWDHILPAYKKMEDHQLGASDMRGEGGPYGVSIPDARDEVTDALFAAARNYGWKVVPDANAEDVERIGFTPSSIRHGKRTSASSAFLRPAMRRNNLTVMTRTRVTYLLFDGKRVVGVRTERKGHLEDFRASKEVLEELTTSRDTVALHRELLALFAGAVGHDGRNALVAITALLSNRELCDVDEIWESAVVQTGVLPKLFNFLEDVGKTGGELRCHGFEMTEATREIVHLSAALRKSYTISLAGMPEEPIDVWGHRTLYMLVLAELVRNAISTMQQRSQGDRVSIAVSPQNDTVCIDIFDNGPGVPDEDREAIFKEGITTRDKGTGRGLYHARASLALMDATITCEQRTGGAHFRIQLRRTASVRA